MNQVPTYPHEDLDLMSSEVAPLTPEEKALIVEAIGATTQTRLVLDGKTSKDALAASTASKERASKTHLKSGLTLDARSSLAWENLVSKYCFCETVRDMGYSSPKQLKHREDSRVKARELKAAIEAELPSERLLLKPLHGSQGEGIKRFNNSWWGRVILRAALNTAHKTLLLQEEIPIETDYRYWGYRMGNGRFYRIAYEKKSPYIISDGRPLALQLLDRNGEFQTSTLKNEKLGILDGVYDRNGVFSAPRKGERVYLVSSGNVHQKAKPSILSDQELSNLDQFMARFLNDLELEINKKLNYFCFDLGALDEKLLEKEYDFEELKKQLFFFEFQSKAGISGYDAVLNSMGLGTEIRNKVSLVCARDALSRHGS